MFSDKLSILKIIIYKLAFMNLTSTSITKYENISTHNKPTYSVLQMFMQFGLFMM